jgi:hypothetical protein
VLLTTPQRPSLHLAGEDECDDDKPLKILMMMMMMMMKAMLQCASTCNLTRRVPNKNVLSITHNFSLHQQKESDLS